MSIVEKLLSEKGKPMLGYEGYIYTLDDDVLEADMERLHFDEYFHLFFQIRSFSTTSNAHLLLNDN